LFFSSNPSRQPSGRSLFRSLSGAKRTSGGWPKATFLSHNGHPRSKLAVMHNTVFW
jgi:hypothetical protein